MTDAYAAFKDEGIPSNQLVVLRQLTDEMQYAEKAVEAAEIILETAKDTLKNIVENSIPSAVDGLDGIFDLKDGRTLTIKEEIRSSIAKEKRVPAIKWLDEHDYGHIVKRQLIFEFTKADQKKFEEFVVFIKKSKLPVNMKENFSVHHATLNSWVKERLSEGDILPTEVFGIYRQRTAKVKE